MKIPSPRKFIEIAAFFVFACFVMAGMLIAIVVLSLMALAEKVVDVFKPRRRRA